MPTCFTCGSAVAYIYNDDDELVVVERTDNGNLSLDVGGLSAHVVAPGSGQYREHECELVKEAA